jgi:microcystin-dependent protein
VAQDYTIVQNSDTLANSLPVFNENLLCLLSNFAGTSFPTTNIAVGQSCYRTDQSKTYRLASIGPAVWTLTENTGSTYLSQELADARYFQQGTMVPAPLLLQGSGVGGADSASVYFYNNAGVVQHSIQKDPSQNLTFARYNSVGAIVDVPLSISIADGLVRTRTGVVWDAGNDGAGSGLDADKLHGVTPGTLGLSALAAPDTATLLSLMGITNGVAQTGQIAAFFATNADIMPGYVPMTGGGIGSAASIGATARANNDCQALYNWLWDRGAAVVGGRGVNHAADWAANKVLVLPDTRGRTLVGLDYSVITGQAGVMNLGNYNAVGDVNGEYLHVLSYGEMPSHAHGLNWSDPSHTHSEGSVHSGGGALAGSVAPSVALNSNTAGVTGGSYTGINASIAAAGGGAAHNNMPPYLLVTFHLKL